MPILERLAVPRPRQRSRRFGSAARGRDGV